MSSTQQYEAMNEKVMVLLKKDNEKSSAVSASPLIKISNDVQISQIANIPYFTIRDWKQKKDNWRGKIYIFLKNTNQEELKEIFSNSINSSNTGLSDSKIAKITTIPLPTLNTWKKDKSTYRKKIYDFLKSCDESRLRNIFL
ncbi:TPA: hypothetical protein R6B22_001786 [Campylobacter coli]|nr:hypothetical protein [Campylobacter coli]